jgi:hypothetical protein
MVQAFWWLTSPLHRLKGRHKTGYTKHVLLHNNDYYPKHPFLRYVSSPPLFAAMGVEIPFSSSGDDGDNSDDEDGSTETPFSAVEEGGEGEEGESSLCP